MIKFNTMEQNYEIRNWKLEIQERPNFQFLISNFPKTQTLKYKSITQI